MKLLPEVKKIIDSYNLKPIKLPDKYINVYQYQKDYPNVKDFDSEKDDIYFFNKYDNHIPEGWYGFSLGDPIVPEWCDIIEKILDVLIKNDPKLEIHQIKVKYGYVCFYCQTNIIEDIDDIEILIANELTEPKLIY